MRGDQYQRLQGSSAGVEHVAVPKVPTTSVLASACQSRSRKLVFVFAVPPSCTVELQLLFADPAPTPRTLSVSVNGQQLVASHPLAASSSGGGTLAIQTTSNTVGLLELTLDPIDDDQRALVNAVQIVPARECAPLRLARSTTSAPPKVLYASQTACSRFSITWILLHHDL